MTCKDCSKEISRNGLRCKSCAKLGSRHHLWKGGLDKHKCVECGTTFTAARTRNRKYCGYDCANAGNTGEKAYNYKGGYERKLWHNRKRLALKAGAEGSHTLGEWEELKNKYQNICVCCKRQGLKLTADHILPLSKGGTDYISNIQPLCGSCNSRKNDEYIDYLSNIQNHA